MFILYKCLLNLNLSDVAFFSVCGGYNNGSSSVNSAHLAPIPNGSPMDGCGI